MPGSETKACQWERHGAGEESYLICQSMQGPRQPIHGCRKGQIGVWEGAAHQVARVGTYVAAFMVTGEGRKESQGPERGGKRADDANRDPAVVLLSRTCLAVGSHQPRARHSHISSGKRRPSVLAAFAHFPREPRGRWLTAPGRAPAPTRVLTAMAGRGRSGSRRAPLRTARTFSWLEALAYSWCGDSDFTRPPVPLPTPFMPGISPYSALLSPCCLPPVPKRWEC